MAVAPGADPLIKCLGGLDALSKASKLSAYELAAACVQELTHCLRGENLRHSVRDETICELW